MTQDLQRLEQRLTQLLNEAEEIQRSIEALNAEKARMVASNPNILASAGLVKSSSPNG
jgi:prefoldin subunit 5